MSSNLIALQRTLETQLAGQLAPHPQNRLIGAEKRGEFDRYVGRIMYRAGTQLNTFGAELLAGSFVAVFNAGVVDGQAVDVQPHRLSRFFRRGGSRWRGFAGGGRRCGRGV